MRLITRLLIASLMGIVVLIGSVSRTAADGSILRARQSQWRRRLGYFRRDTILSSEARSPGGGADPSASGRPCAEQRAWISPSRERDLLSDFTAAGGITIPARRAILTPTTTILSIWATCPTSGPMTRALPYSST